MQWLDFVFGPAKAKFELFTDLLKVASLQGLVSHLTEIHISIVMPQFPLQHTEKHTRVNQLKRTAKWGHFGWSSQLLGPVWGLRQGFKVGVRSGFRARESAVMLRVRSWVMHYIYERCVYVCVCVLISTFRHGGASRSVFSRKQLRDCFLFEPWRKRKQNWVSPRQPGNTGEQPDYHGNVSTLPIDGFITHTLLVSP